MEVITKVITSLAERSENISVTNSIQSLYTENPLATSSSFSVDHTDIKSWELDSTSGTSFNLDVLALINVINANLGGEIKTLHIQSRRRIRSRNEIDESCRFTVTTDQGVMGSMGQITLVDLSNFNYSQLSVSNVIVPEGELGVLTIVIGVNK